jgi:DNA repair exonuclease SbcCD ATPase subunit
LTEIKQKVDTAIANEVEAQHLLKMAQTEETQLQQKLDELNDKLRRQNVKNFTRRLSQLHRNIGERATQLAKETQADLVTVEHLKAPVDRSTVIAAETSHSLKITALNHRQLDVERLAGDVADLRSSVNVVKYWHTSFGPTGISNMVLREAIDPLNELARHISQTLCGGMINVHFDTERELYSGEDKDELVVRVNNVLGSEDLEMSSKGERCLSNLIIAETLGELSQAHQVINFSWYDEVVNNLPAHVRRVVLQYLHDKAQRNQQLIFIVDHYPESSNFSDFVLLAEKTRDGTSLRWL